MTRETQTVKVQHGCGCISSLVTLLLLFAVVNWWSGMSSIDRDGVVLGALAVPILRHGRLVLHRR